MEKKSTVVIDQRTLPTMEPRNRQRISDIGGQMPMIKTGICVYNNQEKVISWNDSAEEILGYTPEEVIGKSVKLFFPMIEQILGCQQVNLFTSQQDMKTLFIEKSSLLDSASQRMSVVVFTDQSLILASQSQPNSERYKDDETGLYNLGSMIDILDQENKRSLRYKNEFSIIAVKIDGFEFIESLHGEGSLELIVQTLAIILKNETRDVDSIGRLSGDLFMISLPNTSFKASSGVARRIERVTKRYSDDETPFTITAAEYQVKDHVDDWTALAQRILVK